MTQHEKREAHERKVEMLLQFASQHKLLERFVIPPWYRFCWRCGWLVRPPHFQPFWYPAAGPALVAAILLGFQTAAISAITQKISITVGSIFVLAGSLLAGLLASNVYRSEARLLKFGSWDNFKFNPVRHHYIR